MWKYRFTSLLLFCGLSFAVHAAETADISLHKAVLQNDAERVRALLAQGVSVDQRDSKERTPLFRAAHRGSDEIIRILLDGHADPNAVDKWGNTPLFEGAQQGQVKAVELLLKSGAKIDATNKHTQTPLYEAVRNGKAVIAGLLLKHGANPNVCSEGTAFAPLHYAAMRGDSDLLNALLEAGSQVDAKGEFNATPLHMAAAHGQPRAVERLLVAGADVNAKTEKGQTPLHFAVTFGYTNTAEVVSDLLGHGADPSIVDANGLTALDIAKKKNLVAPVMAAFADDQPSDTTKVTPFPVNQSQTSSVVSSAAVQPSISTPELTEDTPSRAPLQHKSVASSNHSEEPGNSRYLIIGAVIASVLAGLVLLLKRVRKH